MQPFETHCIVCQKLLKGRTDKKFCHIRCKNSYHSIMRNANQIYTCKTDKFLHRNRVILTEVFRKTLKRKLFVPRETLLKMGFKFEYFTGYHYNKEGKIYHYVYDFQWMMFSSLDVMIIRKKIIDPFDWRKLNRLRQLAEN